MEKEIPIYPAVSPKSMRENDALLYQKISEMERSLTQHEEREEKILADIMNAFPDGTLNHRNAHQSMIDASNAQKKFWDDLRLDLAKKGIWGILLVLVGLVVTGAAAKMGLWMPVK